ncbi:MAG: VWA domain-containing protein [Agarilytica sp.]
MKERDLNEVFQHARQQAPNPGSRQRAITLAKQAFAEAQSEIENKEVKKNTSQRQGFFSWLRLIANSNSGDKETTMNTANPETSTTPAKQTPGWLMPSLGGVSLAILAGVIALRVPNTFNTGEELPHPETAIEYRVGKQSKEQAAVGNSATDAEQEAIVVIARRTEESLEESATALHDSIAATQLAPAKSKAEKKMMAAPMPMTAGPAVSYVARPPQVLPRDRDAINFPVQKENRERFTESETNPVKLVSEEPVSTFSVDVDTASYSFVRSKLNQGYLPDPNAVRIEEFVNYFDYKYPLPKNKIEPFATHVMVGDSPWKAGNKLIHVGIQGYNIDEQPKSNLVFLLDVSGSMSSENKLPLVKQSIALLLDQLRPDDNISLVVYAGAAGTVLEPTQVKEKQKILDALNRLQAGGSTAGAAGINLAYQLAEQNFDKEAVNRIVLATDGDFNVGISDPEKLKTFVEEKRKSGVFLSVLGFGHENYHDAMMQELAQNGNGVAAYIDTLGEAQKLLVNEASSALFTIAKDVKIQMEFNPATVAEYRLIGYETRALKREDFNNDKVDAGDIGAGHSVTAIYEVTPVGSSNRLIDETRYQKLNAGAKEGASANEYALLKLRYKLPKETKSKLITKVVSADTTDMNAWQQESFQFSSAVAGFSQLLKDDKYIGEWNYDEVIKQALQSRGDDVFGYRNEFVQLVRKAKIAKRM